MDKIKWHTNNSWFTHPSKKILIVFIILWFIGFSCSILAATDAFEEKLFQPKNTMVLWLLLCSTLTTLKLVINYFKNSK